MSKVTPEGEALKALGYNTMGSGGRCDFRQLREAVGEATGGYREHAGPFDPSFYPGHQIVEGINYNSLDRIVTAFVDAALATPASDTGLREASERLRIMTTQKLASEMSDEDRENADWQGGYEWFCHEARWLRQALRSALAKLSAPPVNSAMGGPDHD